MLRRIAAVIGPRILTSAGQEKATPEARWFRLLFAASPFPGYQKKLTWLRGDTGGNYYRLEDPPMEGWIYPAMFRYYKKAPKNFYVKAEGMRR